MLLFAGNKLHQVPQLDAFDVDWSYSQPAGAGNPLACPFIHNVPGFMLVFEPSCRVDKKAANPSVINGAGHDGIEEIPWSGCIP
jgi:hypothetical protein